MLIFIDTCRCKLQWIYLPLLWLKSHLSLTLSLAMSSSLEHIFLPCCRYVCIHCWSDDLVFKNSLLLLQRRKTTEDSAEEDSKSVPVEDGEDEPTGKGYTFGPWELFIFCVVIKQKARIRWSPMKTKELDFIPLNSLTSLNLIFLFAYILCCTLLSQINTKIFDKSTVCLH